LITGVLAVSSHRIKIERAREFKPLPLLNMAIQCGPFLLDRRKPVVGLDDLRSARRTFAAVGENGKAAIGVCSEVSLAQLSRILVVLKLRDGVRINRAINLDGGSSSAFWFARENGSAYSIPEWKTVRDFVGIVPR
jgi:hypothetical protein